MSGDPVQLVRERLTVPLDDVLQAVAAFISRFVVFRSERQVTAVALWVAHCYAVAAAPAAAYLRITSAVEESGKTTLLEVLELLLGRRALSAVSISPAAVFRTRDKLGPVALLLDEIDHTLKDRKDDGARDLLAMVNAGYRPSARVIRTVGQNHETRIFAAFGPCAIAGLGSLHPTTESRCIPIVLERKIRGDGERWLRHLHESHGEQIAARLEAWADDRTIGRLREARPVLPNELRDRHAEVWWALFAIADEAGGEWPQRARTAALVLHAARDQATESIGILLLAHIRRAFEEAATDRFPTSDLLRRLVENEEGPWGRWWGSEVEREDSPRAAAVDLAARLRVFRRPDGEPIKPLVIKLPDGSTRKGYRREHFDKAWALYLPPSGGEVTDVTEVTPLVSTVTSVTSVTGSLGGEAPGWRQLQREAGEEPEADETVALARLTQELGADVDTPTPRSSSGSPER